MADYHKIHSKIWTDSWFFNLNHKEKLFFIYLFSNSKANIAGIYELPMPIMAVETGLTQEEITAIFEAFSEADKAYYDDGVVWVKNLRNYHETSSEKLQKGIKKEVKNIHNCALKQRYIDHYHTVTNGGKEGIDTLSEGYSEGSEGVSEGEEYDPSLVLSTSTSTSTEGAREDFDERIMYNRFLAVHLNVPEFLNVWGEWLEYQKEIHGGQDPPEITIKKQAELLSRHTAEEAAKMLETSMTNGWKGLKYGDGSSSSNGAGDYSAEASRAWDKMIGYMKKFGAGPTSVWPDLSERDKRAIRAVGGKLIFGRKDSTKHRADFMAAWDGNDG